jgi:hypothetical protein
MVEVCAPDASTGNTSDVVSLSNWSCCTIIPMRTVWAGSAFQAPSSCRPLAISDRSTSEATPLYSRSP